MAILDLQQRLAEAGRIRQGTTEPATSSKGTRFDRPVKLDTWRLTSKDQQRIEAAATLYGGAPAPWEKRPGEWELITDTDTLDVLVIPGQSLSQSWELWEGGECKRRCDGYQEVLSDQPCRCPPDYDERRDLAKDGKACKPTTRLSVVLPRLPGIGQWRLEARGFYAAVELAAAAQVLEEASRRGALLPARLRLEQRTDRRNGQTRNYRVPVLDLDVSVAQLNQLSQGAAAGQVLDLGYTPVAAIEGPTVREAVEAANGPKPASRQGKTAAPIGAPAIAPSTAPIGDGEPTPAPSVPMITDSQRKLIHAAKKELGLTDERLKDCIEGLTGQRSTSAVPKDRLEALLTLMQAASQQDREGDGEQFAIPVGRRAHVDQG